MDVSVEACVRTVMSPPPLATTCQRSVHTGGRSGRSLSTLRRATTVTERRLPQCCYQALIRAQIYGSTVLGFAMKCLSLRAAGEHSAETHKSKHKSSPTSLWDRRRRSRELMVYLSSELQQASAETERSHRRLEALADARMKVYQ